MRIVTWAVRLLLFLFLVALAAKNAEPVTIRFYFDQALQAPLIAVLFIAFAVGALFGMLALSGTLLRQRRELSKSRSQSRSEPALPPAAPPL